MSTRQQMTDDLFRRLAVIDAHIVRREILWWSPIQKHHRHLNIAQSLQPGPVRLAAQIPEYQPADLPVLGDARQKLRLGADRVRQAFPARAGDDEPKSIRIQRLLHALQSRIGAHIVRLARNPQHDVAQRCRSGHRLPWMQVRRLWTPHDRPARIGTQENSLIFQSIQRLPYGGAADAKLVCQDTFGRQSLTIPELAGHNPILQGVRDVSNGR